MKFPAPSPTPFNFYPVLVVMLALTFSASAQDIHYRDPLDPSKGHWQIFTDATTRTTSIKFFDSKNQLLYEETMQGKYVKLTKRNINQINQTFDLVTQKTLLSPQVKSKSLPLTLNRRPSNRINSDKPILNQARHSKSDQENLNVLSNAFIVPNTAKLYLTFLNPDRERLRIFLKNEEGLTLYSEFLNNLKYKRRFDLAPMPAGKYTIMVTTANQKYKFVKQVVIGPSSRSWQVEEPMPIIFTNKESY